MSNIGWKPMERHKWWCEIKAWADGIRIQKLVNQSWTNIDNPNWNDPTAEYRVRPNEPESDWTDKLKDGPVLCGVSNKDPADCNHTFVLVYDILPNGVVIDVEDRQWFYAKPIHFDNIKDRIYDYNETA